MLKRLSALFVVLLLLAGWWTMPPSLVSPTADSQLSGNVEAALAAGERRVAERYGLIDGAEKRLRWHAAKGTQTEYAVVYLHGFSGSRQEIAPVPELVADTLGANLFETRLSGHGHRSEALAGTRAEDWLADGVEALAVGKALGQRLVVIGTSTGASLALALAEHPRFAAIDTLILLSPNHGPRDPASVWLTRPFGPQIARALVGEYRGFEPANERQALFWSTRYPTAALVEMMRLVDLANAQTPAARVPKALLLYSPGDRVVSVEKLLAAFDTLPAAVKASHAMESTDDPGQHVVAGDILAPANNAEVAERISSFVRSGQALP
ncbi:MAG: alpha/beta fold hydrolase [Pseudomonadota bacterium]